MVSGLSSDVKDFLNAGANVISEVLTISKVITFSWAKGSCVSLIGSGLPIWTHMSYVASPSPDALLSAGAALGGAVILNGMIKNEGTTGKIVAVAGVIAGIAAVGETAVPLIATAAYVSGICFVSQRLSSLYAPQQPAFTGEFF